MLASGRRPWCSFCSRSWQQSKRRGFLAARYVSLPPDSHLTSSGCLDITSVYACLVQAVPVACLTVCSTK
jgi:hypothetical protein